MNDDLGNRMKKYEVASAGYLTPKVPSILRCDGKAFHTLTRDMEQPWDKHFIGAMQKTAKYLCENIQGAVFGYVQSDEISIVLIDWQSYNTTKWFDGKIQKVVSVAAGMASVAFTNVIREYYPDKFGVFDARVFNVPEHDVVNCILWRQQDATRNSIQMLARKHFSHKECHNKNCNDLQEMLMEQKGVNWNDTPTQLKRGTAIVKSEIGWTIDEEMPILSQDREYIKIPTLFENEE